MWWDDFATAAPSLADALREQFEGAGVVLVGTVRRDGSPRISPVEPVVEAGHLYLDMMWHSRKAEDLLRDARVEVHAVPSDRLAPQFKLHGAVEETFDDEERQRFAALVEARFGWAPYPQHHLFRVDVREAAWISYGEDAPDGYLRVRTWSEGAGYRERGPYPPPGSEEAR
ncbi:MAG: pyridoxamine 5'-phosphate oxidase family protein [Dehalococcoidia bacterium]|nr:pyridoxamine 5'-phosphate oxidase family protein [Dehalococcoidia bacterium]